MFINNIPVKIIKDKKFKTVGIKVLFYNSFNSENCASYTLLTRLMTTFTKKYNTNEKMQKITGYLYGTVGVEMESFALFANAKHLGKKAACLLTVSDSLVTHEATSSEERQTSFNKMMEIALETAANL